MAKKSKKRRPRARPQAGPGGRGAQQAPAGQQPARADPQAGHAGRGAAPATRARARRRTSEDEAAPQTKEQAKKARREQARRERAAFRRKQVRRRLYRRAAYVLIAAAAITGILFAVNRPKHGRPLNAEEQTLLASAPAGQKAAGCGAVQTIRPYPNGEDRAHIGVDLASKPPLSAYPSHPPASGPHDPSTVGAGIYTDPPPIEQAIHSLEHGAIIVWHAPTVAGPELTKLQSFFRKPAERDHVIVAPYSYPTEGPAGQLAAGKQMVLVAWHHMQTCTDVNLAATFAFVANYRFPAPAGEAYKGDAPEQRQPI